MTSYLPNITNLMSWEAIRHLGRWTTFDEMKDGRSGEGSIALVTGGNGAVGQRISEVLVARGYTVYLASRDLKRGQDAIDAIKQKDPNATGKLELLQLDLADLAGVRRAAEDFKAKETKLHLLINNGGIMVSADGKLSPDGVEYMMATNCLGPYYLTQLLTPCLKAAAATSPSYSVRVVNLSSMVHAQAPSSGIDFTTLDKPTKNIMTVTGSLPYNQSKLGDIIWTHSLAKQLNSAGVMVLACHPGIIKSPLWDGSSALRKLFFKPVMLSPVVGARTPLYCALSPEIIDKHNGGYYIPVGKKGKPLHSKASDAQLESKFCQWMDGKVVAAERR